MDSKPTPYSLESMHKKSSDLLELQRQGAHARAQKSTDNSAREFSAWVTPYGVALRESLDVNKRFPLIERVSMRFDEFDELATLIGYVKKDPNA